MLLTLHTITTASATVAATLLNGLTAPNISSIINKRTFNDVVLFVDADMSATGTPNFDVKVSMRGLNGSIDVADTSTGTSLTTDGIYLLQPSVGFRKVDADGPCIFPLRELSGMTATVTEVSGTGSIVLANVYALIPD